MAIKAKPITAKVPPVENYIKEIDKLADGIGKFLSEQFKKTTRTWSAKNRPRWVPIKKKSRSKISVEVSTDKDIYRYVSGGTKVRRAFMIPPFKAKTKVGRIVAKKGQFSGVVVSKKFNLPGIKAREFDKQIKPLAERRLRRDAKKLSAKIRSLQ